MKKFNEDNMRDASNMKVGDYGFQGDVIVKKIEENELFDSMNTKDDGILALGEATGHMHKLHGDFDLRTIRKKNDKGEIEELRYFKVDDEAILKHQEHSPIKIGPGFYKVEIQKEYDHFAQITRTVMD